MPALLALPLLLLLGVPVAVIFARGATGALVRELREPETLSAIAISLATSTGALLATIAVGTPVAYWLSRSNSRWSRMAEALIDLPTVLPPSIAGVALLLTLGRQGVIGSWLSAMGVQIAFTPLAVVIAQVFVASPYYVRAARAGFEATGADLREAATIDGASEWGLLRHLLAPLASPSLAAGAAMCWSRAVGEFGATILFAGNLPGVTQTMPLAVYLGLEGNLDRALALSTILIAIAVAMLALVRLLRRRAGAALA